MKLLDWLLKLTVTENDSFNVTYLCLVYFLFFFFFFFFLYYIQHIFRKFRIKNEIRAAKRLFLNHLLYIHIYIYI